MEKRILQPETLHKPFSAYSHGIEVKGANRLVFCAGQVAGDAEGNIVGEGDFDAQGEQVMSNLRDVLAEAGASFAGRGQADNLRRQAGRHSEGEGPCGPSLHGPPARQHALCPPGSRKHEVPGRD